MTAAEIDALRNRAAHYLSHEVAQAAGLRLEDLQQFIARAFTPSGAQLLLLSRRMGLDG